MGNEQDVIDRIKEHRYFAVKCREEAADAAANTRNLDYAEGVRAMFIRKAEEAEKEANRLEAELAIRGS